MKTEDVSPPLRQFVNACSEKFNIHDLSTFWSCEENFRALVRDFEPTPVLNHLVTRVKEDPLFEMPTVESRKIVLAINEKFSVSMDDQAPPSKYLYSHPFLGMIGVIGEESVEYDIYQLPENWNNHIFDPVGKLRHTDTRIAKPGEIIMLDGNNTIIDMKICKPTYLLKFFSGYLLPLEWAYYRDTLLPWQVVASDAAASRQDYMIKVISHIGNEGSIPVLGELAKSPLHYVRWSAIQATAALDGAAGMALLRTAADDVHPHIQASTRQALLRLDN